MSRVAEVPLMLLAFLLPFAAGCGHSDQPRITSASGGDSSPAVSETATVSSEGAVTTSTPVNYERAESAFTEGRYPEAKQLFGSYTGAHPENPWGYYMLGLSSWKSGDRDQALNSFDKALQLDPDHRKSLFNSSRVLLELGRSTEALERIEKALEAEPLSNEGLRLLGRARYQLGDADQAIEAYHRALVADERDVWAMNNLGLIYIEQDRSSDALGPLARAVELRSDSPVFQNNLGVALERSGYPVAAAKAYEAAIAADSSYTKASVALARVTDGEEKPESDSVDVAAVAQRFQDEIASWRGSTPASVTAIPQALSDSTHSALDSVADTLEDSTQE